MYYRTSLVRTNPFEWTLSPWSRHGVLKQIIWSENYSCIIEPFGMGQTHRSEHCIYIISSQLILFFLRNFFYCEKQMNCVCWYKCTQSLEYTPYTVIRVHTRQCMQGSVSTGFTVTKRPLKLSVTLKYMPCNDCVFLSPRLFPSFYNTQLSYFILMLDNVKLGI